MLKDVYELLKYEKLSKKFEKGCFLATMLRPK